MGDHLLDHLHHVVVVGVCLVALEQCELRVVVLVDALVAEDATDFIDLVEAAYDEALQVQLRGDAQVELLVEGVVVSDEGSGIGAGGNGHQHRRVDLEETALIEEPADAADDTAAQPEDVHVLAVGDKVQVALTVTGLGIAQAVILLGQRAHPLGDDDGAAGVYGDLASAGTDEVALDAQMVADVQVPEQFEVFAEVVATAQGLD